MMEAEAQLQLNLTSNYNHVSLELFNIFYDDTILIISILLTILYKISVPTKIMGKASNIKLNPNKVK